jgi:two-component system cell cycle sensor histidine kinase/response regulator CckA
MTALVSWDATILYASPSTERNLGYPIEEFVGRNAFELVHPDDQEHTRALFRQLLATPGREVTAEYRLRTKDAAWRWVEGTAKNLLEDPKVGAVVACYRDISERKRARDEREAIFEIIHAVNVTSSLDELLPLIHNALKKVVSAENCFVALHNHATGLFHFPFFVDRYDSAPPPQRVGRSCTAYVFRTGRPMLIPQSEFDRLVEHGEVELVGTPSPAWLGVPLRTPRETIGVLVLQHYEDARAYAPRDLDFLASVGGQIALAIERKQADDSLRKQQQEQEVILHSAPAMIFYKDTENRILRANRAAADSLQLSVSEVEGKSSYELFPEHAAQYHQDDLEVIHSGKPKLGIVEPYRNAAGEMRWVRTDKIPYRDQDGRIIGVIVFAADITEQQHAEEALRRSEANYRSLVEGVPHGIYRVNAAGTLLDVNPAMVEMLGYSSAAELMGENIEDKLFAEPADRRRIMAENPDLLHGVEVPWKRKDGSRITVRLSGRLVPGASGSQAIYERIAENVTEQRVLEQQLRQAQKMEAVGRLAGGVAHDFNNLLMVIKGHSELLLDAIRGDDRMTHKVAQIQKAADRATALTRQLLAFSRMQVLQPKVVDLNTIVADMGRLLPRLIGEDIDLRIVCGEHLGRIKADPGQIEQVLMNLAVNARDAMPDGGKLVIATENAELDQAYARRHPAIAPGRYIMLSVSDTGLGMDAETQAHIFEPFFTTKEQGKGTGLGLATVYGVVKQSGGYIWVYSEPGQGTSFKLYFPRVDSPAEATKAKPLSDQLPRGSETILLVEDEQEVRDLTSEFLRQCGYTVLEAKDGIEAIEVADKHSGPIHLLLTDMVMPAMGGRELASRLGVLRPDLKMIFMSGYAEFARQGPDDDATRAIRLAKPFSRAVLAKKVREVFALRSAE